MKTNRANSMKRDVLFSLVWIILCSSLARAEVVVESLQGNGTITWSAPVNSAARYDIEWAYEADGPWHKTFQNVRTMDAFNDTQFVARVPMFYRVVQTTNAYPFPMAYIEGGDARLGQDGFADTGFTNYISPFWIDRTEVSIELWQDVYQWATNNGYHFDNPGSGKTNNHPVYNVNWYDAVKWCNARSEKEGLDVVYLAGLFTYRSNQVSNVNLLHERNGYRLPTESEWEKAARGGRVGYRFPWANQEISHSNANYLGSDVLAYDIASNNVYHPLGDDGIFPYTLPVGSLPPNAFGVHDMAGNVEEWIWDRADTRPTNYLVNYTGSTDTSVVIRVIRGGSWRYQANYLRNSDRYQGIPTNNFVSEATLGFRTVRSAW